MLQLSSQSIDRAGVNPIEVLLWSRGKTLKEVQERLDKITGNVRNGKIKEKEPTCVIILNVRH